MADSQEFQEFIARTTDYGAENWQGPSIPVLSPDIARAWNVLVESGVDLLHIVSFRIEGLDGEIVTPGKFTLRADF